MLVATRVREFTSMIQQHRRRLLQSMTEAEIEKIEDEFQALKRAYSKEGAMKRQIDEGVPNQCFEAAWEPIQGQFPLLNEFVGGLATVFPGT